MRTFNQHICGVVYSTRRKTEIRLRVPSLALRCPKGHLAVGSQYAAKRTTPFLAELKQGGNLMNVISFWISVFLLSGGHTISPNHIVWGDN
jgi:hypothetical protein